MVISSASSETSGKQDPISVSNVNSWRAALETPRPVLVHLNADTTWLLQLPVPAGLQSMRRQTRFNILVDPWLQGPQSDIASWFSTQWHVVAPSVGTIAELNTLLRSLEGPNDENSDEQDVEGGYSCIDAVVVSHEFTDHCHKATLLELPTKTPIFATEQAAKLIQSWNYFDSVTTTPAFSSSSPSWRESLADSTLPPWIGIGRAVTAGNALYYHSAVLIVFDLEYASGPSTRTRSRRASQKPGEAAEAVIYSPHGINAADLECIRDSGIKTLALLHGLHDVRIWMTAQLNLGALSGIQAAEVCGAKYWAATHDEMKRGGGLVSWFLRRTQYTLGDAVKAQQLKSGDEGGRASSYEFVELGSGDILLLS